MRLLATLLALAASSLLPAAAPTEIESQRYLVKAYDERCRLLASGELNLSVAEPDESGVRRIIGSRVFAPQVEDAYPFMSIPRELVGRIGEEVIRLNLDRNVFDANTYVRGRMIDVPEPGFEGTWAFVGWGFGPSGRIIAARAPAEPTKACEDLPEPVTAKDRREQMSEFLHSMENGLKPLPKQKHDRPSDTSQNEGCNGNEDNNEGGSQDS